MDAAMSKALLETAGTGEVLTLCYNAGSRPGEARQLIVLQINDSSFSAVEPGKRRKLYKLEQVAWVEFSDGRRFVNADAPPPGPAKIKKTPPPLTPEEEAQYQRLKEAIDKGQTLLIEMGDALNKDMENVPWRGFMAPIGFRNSPYGLCVTCELEAEHLYYVIAEYQMEGRRHLHVCDFEILGISDHRIEER